MSYVTNVIIAEYGSSLNVSNYIDELNQHCFSSDKSGFAPVDITSLKSTGGSKYMNGSIIVGGFNYLDIDEFIKNLKSFDWKGLAYKHNKQPPYSVDLFYLIENDENGYNRIIIYRS